MFREVAFVPPGLTDYLLAALGYDKIPALFRFLHNKVPCLFSGTRSKQQGNHRTDSQTGQEEAYLLLFREFMHRTRGLRRLGSAATDLAYVACGRFEAFYEYSLQPWDVSAGAFLVQQAGGRLCDFQGGNDFLFGKSIVACNPGVFEELMVLVKKHF